MPETDAFTFALGSQVVMKTQNRVRKREDARKVKANDGNGNQGVSSSAMMKAFAIGSCACLVVGFVASSLEFWHLSRRSFVR